MAKDNWEEVRRHRLSTIILHVWAAIKGVNISMMTARWSGAADSRLSHTISLQYHRNPLHACLKLLCLSSTMV